MLVPQGFHSDLRGGEGPKQTFPITEHTEYFPPWEANVRARLGLTIQDHAFEDSLLVGTALVDKILERMRSRRKDMTLL
jgi:hypothetical protein